MIVTCATFFAIPGVTAFEQGHAEDAYDRALRALVALYGALLPAAPAPHDGPR